MLVGSAVFLMKALRSLLVCLLFGAVARADLAMDIQAIVDAEMAAYNVAGAVVGVWRGNEEVTVFARGFSDLSGSVPLSVTDHFRIASITKTFSTTRVLQLADAGDLSLSDPIDKYVSGLANGSATLRQLGDMTAGFFNYTHAPEFQAGLAANPLRVWSPTELVSIAETNGPSFAPGTSWEYSNTHTLLLQMVIEQVTGRSVAEEFRDAFFAPLSLTTTSYPSTPDLPASFARGYFVDPDTGAWLDVTETDPSIAAGAGAIVSTLGDVRTWIEALGKGNLISPEAQAERLIMNPAGDGYDAYGFGIARIGDWIGHDGVFPGYQSVALYDPTMDQTIVILANSMDASSDYHFPDAVVAQITPLLVPEPSTYALLALSAAGVGAHLLRRRGEVAAEQKNSRLG